MGTRAAMGSPRSESVNGVRPEDVEDGEADDGDKERRDGPRSVPQSGAEQGPEPGEDQERHQRDGQGVGGVPEEEVEQLHQGDLEEHEAEPDGGEEQRRDPFPGKPPPRRPDGDEGKQQEQRRDHHRQRQQEHEDALAHLVLAVRARDGVEDSRRGPCRSGRSARSRGRCRWWGRRCSGTRRRTSAAATGLLETTVSTGLGATRCPGAYCSVVPGIADSEPTNRFTSAVVKGASFHEDRRQGEGPEEPRRGARHQDVIPGIGDPEVGQGLAGGRHEPGGPVRTVSCSRSRRIGPRRCRRGSGAGGCRRRRWWCRGSSRTGRRHWRWRRWWPRSCRARDTRSGCRTVWLRAMNDRAVGVHVVDGRVLREVAVEVGERGSSRASR